jgi:hypothetical protein
MGTPVRFPFGVNNSRKFGTFHQYLGMAPNKVFEDFDDFNRFAAAEWTITRVGTTPTEALTDVNGGAVLLTTVASASSSTFLQRIGASFLPAAGKQMWGSTRFQVSDASDTTFAIGLQLTDTTPLDATDGMYFLKAAASTSIDFVCRKDATTGSTSRTGIATLTSATFIELGFYYDGKRTIDLYVNDRNVSQLDLTTSPAAFLPDAQLRPSFGVANGASAARTMTMDYLHFAIER